MHNWSVDEKHFKREDPKGYKLWKLVQLINYGLDGEKLSEAEIKKYWPKLKKELDPERARMLEYIVWGKVYSLPPKKKFWGLSPKTYS